MQFKIITFLLLISTIIGFGQASNSKAADNRDNHLYSELNKENKHKDRDKEDRYDDDDDYEDDYEDEDDDDDYEDDD